MKLKDIQLNEALFPIDDFVDKIYDEYFSDFYEPFKKWLRGGEVDPRMRYPRIREILGPDGIRKLTRNKYILKALDLNPLYIRMGFHDLGNSYSPGSPSQIRLTPNKEAISVAFRSMSAERSFDDLLEQMPINRRRNFINEINGKKMKESIAHEVSHWLNDTFHGRNIQSLLSKATQAKSSREKRRILTRGTLDVYMTDYEIDAMIHGIRQLKRTFSQSEWDSFTFEDLLEESPPLWGVRNKIQREHGNRVKEWDKLIKKRLFREGLLGRNMR